MEQVINMHTMQAFVKMLLDPLSLQIVQLAVRENLYPNEIAKRIGKSNSLVVKRLKALEARGMLEGHFVTENGRAVKKYSLASEELNLKINFISGGIELLKRRRAPFEEIASSRPELFESYKDYCFWASAKPREVASLLTMPEHEAVKIAQNIKDNIEDVFAAALKARVQNWKKGAVGTYFTFVSDVAVIPTQRLDREAAGIDRKLLERLFSGEAMLSALHGELGINDLERQVEELSKNKMVMLEEKTIPVLNYGEINRVTGQRLKEKNGAQQLHALGRATGEKLASLLGESIDEALRTLFAPVEKTKTPKGEQVSLRRCVACEGIKEKACYFVAGTIEAIFESRGVKVAVREEACKGEGAKACVFAVEPKVMQAPKGTERVKELLG